MTDSNDRPVNPLSTLVEMAWGSAIAYEFKRLLNDGHSAAVAESIIRSNPIMQAAGKIFKPIGLTVTALSVVADAVFYDGVGSADAYIYAAGKLSAGILAAGLAAFAFGLAPFSISGLFVGILATQYGEALFDSLWRQFNSQPIDPLIVDLDGDGVELIARTSSHAYFDLDGDGFAEQTGWVKSDDGILAVDTNGNGKIDDISELFGSATTSGFAVLQAFDTNHDGKVSALDSGFSSLKIWRDLDGDGQTDSGELQTLAQVGITSIGLTATTASGNIGGNQVVKTGSVTFGDGSVKQSAEVLFDLSQVESKFILPAGFTYDSDVFTLPTLGGSGEIPDLWVSMSMDDAVKTDARNLISQARTGDYSGFETAFDGFLNDWAGVADVVWMQDAPTLWAAYVFDKDAYDQWLIRENDNDPSPNPLPPILGYVFHTGLASTGDADYNARIDAWLAEHNYAAPDAHGGTISNGGGPAFSVQVNGGIHQQTLPFKIMPATVGGPDPTPAPAMDATTMAFLQKLMGQDYTRATNFVAPDNVLVANITAPQIAALEASYADVKDYMMARFLAQAAHTILAEEGPNADLGALAPIAHVFYNPFEDDVVGDVEAFTGDLITAFRADPLKSDAEALHLLGMFKGTVEYLDAYVADQFPDISRTLIAANIGKGLLLEGGAGADSITLNQAGTALGHAGDDTLTGSAGDDVLLGGEGNDLLVGGNGNDAYLIGLNDGNDRIVETGGASDTIRFSTGITLAGITAAVSNLDGDSHLDLTLTIAGGGTLTIEDMLSQTSTIYSNVQTAAQIEWFEFADGTKLSRADFLRLTYFAGTSGNDSLPGTYFNDTISGGLGNDTMLGGAGDDTYLVDRGRGDDRIVEDGGANDTIRFAAGITLADLTAVASNLDGDSHLDLTFGFKTGTGSFTIEDMLSQTSTIYSNVQTAAQIEWFEFADGTRLSRADFLRLTYFAGTSGNDSLPGTYFDDTFTGSAGNDTMLGGEGNDIYLVDRSQGDDRIVEGGGANDTIRFAAGITLADLTAVASNLDGDSHLDLTFGFKTGTGSFTIEDMLSQTWTGYSNVQTATQIEWFEFADGTRLSRADFLRLTYFAGTSGNDSLPGTYFDDTFTGSAGNDTMLGGAGDDTYLVDRGQGDDRIVEDGGANDTIRFAAGITLADLTAVASNLDGDSHLDLTFGFKTGTGSFTIEDMLSQGPSWNTNIQNTSQIEWFEFSDGILSGLDGDDILIGGGGNDNLTGGLGADHFLFTSTVSGVDTIADFNQLDGGADEFDVLEFQGLLVGTFAYLGSGAFSGGSDNSEARVAGNQVLVDTNGDGTADITITLTGLANASQIGADDFLFT